MWSSLQKFRHAAVNFLVYVFDRAHRAVFRAVDALPGAALGDLFRILAARAQVSFILLVDVGLRVCRLCGCSSSSFWCCSAAAGAAMAAVAAVAAATTAAAATATIAAAKALSSCEDGARERPLFTCF